MHTPATTTMGSTDRILAMLIRDGEIRTDDHEGLKAIGVTPRRLAVYVHAIRNDHGIPLESIKLGRKVIAYALIPVHESNVTVH